MIDLGGPKGLSTGQRALIRRASWLEIRLRRSERASLEGHRLADNVVLSWISCQRRLLSSLGLRKVVRAESTSLDDVVNEIEQAKTRVH